MKIKAFITQHRAETISDCQDRFAVNKDNKIVAVSDGVSQSIFPDYWAQLLVDFYVRNGRLLEEDRVKLCSDWKNMALQYVEQEKNAGRNPWLAENSLAEGYSAGATLCGLKFTEGCKWICNVIGDSCLVKVDEKKSIELLSSEEKAFDSYPDYLDSAPRETGRGDFKTFDGELKEGCKLLLVTDAFSDFFYKLESKSAAYIEQLLSVNNHEEFVYLVEQWRDNGMHDDDSTAVMIEYDGSPDFNIVAVDDIKVLAAKSEGVDKETHEIENKPEEVFPIREKEDSENQPLSESEKEIENQPSTEVPENNNVDNAILPDTEKETNDDVQNVKDECNDTIGNILTETDKVRLREIIPDFIDEYLGKDEKRGIIRNRNLLKYIFTGFENKEVELKQFIEEVLNNYVDYIK